MDAQCIRVVSLMIIVTAASFIKVTALRRQLEASFPQHKIIYLDEQQVPSREHLVSQLQGAKAWLVGREQVDAKMLHALPELRVIAKYGVGLDNLDLDACARHGIRIAWEAGVNRDAVAEHTLGLMLALCRNIGLGSRLLSQGIWFKNGGRSLSGMKIGLIGLGNVGTRVAELLQVFGCSLLVFDIIDKDQEAERLGASLLSYEEVLRQADLISFHVPLTQKTRHMLDRVALTWTKQGTYLVNTSRGEVFDQSSLKEALRSGHLAGAALDVFDGEPLKDKDLYSLDNFIGTAHTAGNSQEAVLAMGQAAIRGLQKELSLLVQNSDLN
ncbi:MAG: phosphoglycerate dehydrogenase [Proteobacteria bacterium]|nr:phosphoglycerate dehydrogenase [Pseudomonadota bacterium]